MTANLIASRESSGDAPEEGRRRGRRQLAVEPRRRLLRGHEVGGRVEQLGHELAGAFALAHGVIGGNISDALSAP